MSTLRVGMVLAIAAIGIAGERVGPYANQEIWNRLERKTGWVLLGDVDAVSKRWVVATNHRIVTTSTASQEAIPVAGDLLVFDRPVPLVILGFAVSAELRQFEPPVNTQIRGANDVVGELAEGSRVRVEDVRMNMVSAGPQRVFVRVTPASSPW